ncbi:hypothetical protein PAXRUDRAFT_827280 [Paxillus rubicundulus Ve08.2h10]|uniref:GSKIP domain-containing protein n=1 Tax=Paxillus rubicundulus Ve08.2h10 TaxID=930991 RepID=A0A0D0DQZ5_9AGAM|nr:hypothetical protein PAXRUDRAFT_827280 [Paxillus rubicundulus Ve08.2h10]
MSVPHWMSRLYNRVSKGWRPNFQATDNMTSSSSSFYYNELRRALSEQSFGLTRYDVARQYTAHEASAFVTLLEGTTLKVSLNARGYRFDGGQTLESIEGLLQSVSPMYLQKRRDTLFAKLQDLQ